MQAEKEMNDEMIEELQSEVDLVTAELTEATAELEALRSKTTESMQAMISSLPTDQANVAKLTVGQQANSINTNTTLKKHHVSAKLMTRRISREHTANPTTPTLIPTNTPHANTTRTRTKSSPPL